MDHLCKLVLAQLQEHSEDDPIHDCGLSNLHELPNDAVELFDIANEKLHVFPFVGVKMCWFRLYTDTSIARAVKKIQLRNVEVQHNAVATEWLDEIVSILDMALIMAGGLGRETVIENILKGLQDATEHCEEHPAANEPRNVLESEERPVLKELQNTPECNEEMPQKRRKLDSAIHSDEVRDGRNCEQTSSTPGRGSSSSATSVSQPIVTKDSQDDILSTEVVSLPTIRRPVRRLQAPSSYEFQQYMNVVAKPLVLTGIITNWPALNTWNSVAFWLERTFGGRRLVPIEVGRSYTDDGWGQKIVPFREFLHDYILDKSEPQQPQEGSNIMLRGTNQERPTGYLAQHDLFHQIPSLCSDIAAPDYCYLDAPPPREGTPVANKLSKGSKKQSSKPSYRPYTAASQQSQSDLGGSNGDVAPNEVHTNMWFGPAWTISPLHHDPYHNILCQVVGKKYVRLYSPEDSHRLYPRSEREEAPDASSLARRLLDGSAATSEREAEKHWIDMSNTSTVDVAEMELSPAEDWDAIYPGISNVPYVECVLEAGEALYIPVGWWHYVRSCSVGISVSFWW
jgi:lysine-specific demethylase 8